MLVGRGDQTYLGAFDSRSIVGPPMERDLLFRISSVANP